MNGPDFCVIADLSILDADVWPSPRFRVRFKVQQSQLAKQYRPFMGCVYTPNNIKVVRQWPWFTEWIINHTRRRDEVPSLGQTVGGLL